MAHSASANVGVNVQSLPTPSGPQAMGSSLFSDGDAHWLSWLDQTGKDTYALRCARFDASRAAWGSPITIATGSGWVANWADFPTIAARGDSLVAVWSVENPPDPTQKGHHGSGYHALYSMSRDGGRKWSRPQKLTKETPVVEFVVVQPLADGRFLAAWLDGRLRRHGGQNQQALYSRVLGDGGPDVLVDPKVCDCCQLSLVSSPGGGAYLAYRGRTDEEIRDIHLARFEKGKWTRLDAIHPDAWKIAGCPVNGPQLAERGANLGAAWFTSPGEKPRVLFARKGTNEAFSAPLQVDLGAPLGRVDTVFLDDGTALITWLEAKKGQQPGGIYLRSVTTDGNLAEPALLATSSSSRASGFPRMTVLSGAYPAKLLLTYTRDGEKSEILTSLVTISASTAN